MHDVLLDRYGGSAGGGSRGGAYEGVDAAVQAVKNSYYETLPELAASHAVYIVQGHVFLDGNKRTGAAAMLTFLEANGTRSGVAVDALATAMIELQRRAESGQAVTELVRWLAALLSSPSPRRRRAGRTPAHRPPAKS